MSNAMKNPEWIDVALLELGVSEWVGAAHNPRILEYHAETALHARDDETPWCASFVNWTLKQCGIAGTKSASARSFLRWGEVLKQPQYGCIVVFSSSRGPAAGHVGFFLSERGGKIRVLGGNQGGSVGIAEYSAERVIGYRWPEGAE